MSNEVYISFIMPAINSEKFIGDAIDSVVKQTKYCWELIIIDDNSTDTTYDIAHELAKNDSRIHVHKNIGQGKVQGLNYGFTLCKGQVIKCIDSDDILHSDFIADSVSSQYDAMYHDSYITSSKPDDLRVYKMKNTFVNKTYEHCLVHFRSLPRWTWTFTREIANRIFPMPSELPYEDLWFSLIIKRNARNILYFEKPLYYYRQHVGQTFGGFYNYDKAVVLRRSGRRLQYLKILADNYASLWNSKSELEDKLSLIREYLEIITNDNIGVYEIFHNNLPFKLKIKIFLIRKIPWLVSTMKKYNID